MKPLILVPTSEQHISNDPIRLYFNRAYATSIEKAGGVVLGIARPTDPDTLDQLIALADGLYITGGHDMDPKWYNETSRPEANNDEFDAERDTLELELITRALARKMPIIGICRGMQDLNVHFGGSLYQDLKLEHDHGVDHDHRKTTNRDEVAHTVNLDPGSMYGKIVGADVVHVNSLHHQGIKILGKDLRAAGHTADGLIEAIEAIDHPFCVGVQWHPEELGDEPSLRLFNAFISACAEFRATKNR